MRRCNRCSAVVDVDVICEEDVPQCLLMIRMSFPIHNFGLGCCTAVDGAGCGSSDALCFQRESR